MIDVAVTGADGFIGKAICRRLKADGMAVAGVGREIGDVAVPGTWERVPPAKVLVHLAARSYVPDSWNDPIGFLSANVLGTENAIGYCRRHGARMVCISAYIYGIPESLPIREDHPVRPNNPYALSKHLAEQVCGFASQYQGVPVVLLRLFNVFGPGQRQEFLIPSIVAQVRQGKEIRVLDLAPRRDYLYLADVVDSIARAIVVSDGYHVVNIGSGVSLSVREIIDQIQKAAGAKLPVFGEHRERPQEIPDVRADIEHARELLGWQPRLSFLQGVQQLLSMEKLCD
jgi:GDP-4-dehydro-6-deoxy-D-mannose reductase